MFPTGAPGVALLVLRLCLVAALARFRFAEEWLHLAWLVLLSMVCVGILTPVACVALVILGLFDIPNNRDLSPVEAGLVLLSTASFAILGPGAYSVDGRLFGRRMLVSTDSSRKRKNN